MIKERLRRSWNAQQATLGRHPSIYLPFARRRYGRDRAYSKGCEIVIEGFPRSANSFSVNAFELAQDRPVQIAHHVHAPAQVLAAVSDGVPAIVLARRPKDAVLSLLLWHPHLRVRDAVRSYDAFYRPLLPHTDGFVVGEFSQVTGDFGSVIRRVNERFGCDFAEFESTPENLAACFDTIEANSRRQRGGVLLERVVARPSQERQALKQALSGQYDAQIAPRRRAELDDLYETFRRLSEGE